MPAKKKVVNGIEFDSGAEAEYYEILKAREDAGEITNLEMQPEFTLFEPFQLRKRKVRGMIYTPDFSFWENGEYNVVEVKGFARDRYNITRKIFLYMYGDTCIFHEAKKKGKKWSVRVW